ncbi:RICIN domain-containing protein [Micromonospora sp. NPDC051925]|uniref:RICIN domain-containing protein n=1 Tax=Micromonospora sp. NPDC051925 TaxID=3364288 RepID=UPI0037CA116F
MAEAQAAAARSTLPVDYYEFRARHSDRCLDVTNASTAHGAQVVQGTCWGGTTQHRKLVNAGTWS